MSRLVNEPIIVHISDSIVRAFIWHRRNYRVLNVLSSWSEGSKWWEGEPIKHFIRVIANNKYDGIYELYQAGKKWFLHSILD